MRLGDAFQLDNPKETRENEMEIATKEQRKERINRRRETEIRKERKETNGQEQGVSGQGIMIFVFIPLRMPLRSWSSCRGHRVDDRDAPTRRKEAICWERFCRWFDQAPVGILVRRGGSRQGGMA